VVVGALTTAQSRVNGELSTILGNGIQTAFVSFSTGLLCLSLYAAFSSKVRLGVSSVFESVRSGNLRWWQVIGGTVGATFVAIQSLTVPQIGVAIFTIAIVGGQTASSLLVDRFGIGPQGHMRLTANRMLAAALAVVAVAVAVSHRIDAGEIPLLAVIAAFGIGAGVSFQHALNGHVSMAAGSPISAALINFIFGTSLLAIGLLATIVTGHSTWQPLPSGPVWLYFGGIFGLLFIVTASHVIRKLGSLRFAMGSVSGQLIGSLLFDIFAPTDGAEISAQLIGGVLLTGLAVIVANLRPSKSRANRLRRPVRSDRVRR
jgi:transporter family-2 protein